MLIVFFFLIKGPLMLKKRYPNFFKKQHKKRYFKVNKFYQMFFFEKNSRRNKKFHQVYLVTTTNTVLPKRVVPFFRKHFRKFFKKRKIRCFFLIHPNYLVSAKNKNSRMGKGVGAIKRRSYLLSKQQPFLLLKNCSFKRALLLSKFFTKRFKIKVIPRIK